MEFKFRGVNEHATTSHRDQPPPPPSSRHSLFIERVVRAASAAEASGLEHEYVQSADFLREAIQRELDKERIREEIIAEENARRRILEDEVRREMRIERELALRGSRGTDGFSKHVAGVGISFEPRMTCNERRLFEEEKSAKALEGRLVAVLKELGSSGRFNMEEPWFKEILQPPSEVSREVKLGATSSGLKRKAVTLPEGKGELTSTNAAKKKWKEDWSCALCRISVTNKLALDDHIQGKKHKSKEASLRAEKNRKNDVDPPGKTGSQLEKEKHMLWCDVCNVGANSEVVMESHMKGKKHAKSLRAKLLKSVALPTAQVVNEIVTDVTNDRSKNGDAESVENVSAVDEGVRVKNGDDKATENVDTAGMLKAESEGALSSNW